MPAIRLYGSVGEIREATDREIDLFRKRVRLFRLTKGYSLMWSDMRMVRDIHFSRIEPVQIGKMTRNVGVGDK